MNFSLPVKLVSVTTSQNELGVVTESREYTDVFANPYTIGSAAWAAARSVGLHADAEIQVRTFEYGGQEFAEINGREYTVERASDEGELTRLTLSRRLKND